MKPIITKRMVLVPATVELLSADINDRINLGELLNADIPDNWPPEILSDALSFFLDALREKPSRIGWNAWYWLRHEPSDSQLVLIGSGGFKGEPDANGQVEIGHSLLPQFQNMGYATEGAQALITWAFSHPEVMKIIGETEPTNKASIHVLEKLGFSFFGSGSEPGTLRYQRTPQN
jgi:[ribosomal protein S5]-alanine N-acetyltransferase